MIKNGANDLNSSLNSACFAGYMPIIQLLIDNGANDWNLGLFGACAGKNVLAARLMISKGANNAEDYLDVNNTDLDIKLSPEIREYLESIAH
jgi:hypothetical protein